MYDIRNATPGDVDAALDALGDAFAPDPLMAYLFGEHPAGIRAAAMAFFSILLRARLALGMPALVLRHRGGVAGAAMGYDTARPVWPDALRREWGRFEGSLPGLAARMAAYDAICEAYQPGEPHHYLGVIGVHPSLQGQGAGKALLDAFCAGSSADPASRGVYLDTCNPGSLRFYRNNGFALRGEGRLGAAPLWCVYRPT